MVFIKHQKQKINGNEYEYYYLYESYYNPGMEYPQNFKVGKVGDDISSLVSNLKDKASDKDIDLDQDDIDHFKIQLNTVEAKAKEEGIEEDELGEFYDEAFSGELGEEDDSEDDSEESKEDQLYDYKIGSVEGWKEDNPRKVTELGWTLEDDNEYGLQIFREENREEDPWTVFAYKEIEDGDGQTHPMSEEFDSREEAKKFAEEWMQNHQKAEDISVKSDSVQSKNKNFCPEGARNLHGEGFCVVHSEVDPVDIEEAEKVYRDTLDDIHPNIPEDLKEKAVDMAKSGADNSVFDTEPFTDEKMKKIDGMIRLYKFIEDNEPVNSSFVTEDDFEKTYITDNLISDSFMVLEMEDFIENPEHYTYVTKGYEGSLKPTNIPDEKKAEFDYQGLVYGVSEGDYDYVKVLVNPNPDDSDVVFGSDDYEEKLKEPIMKGQKVSVKINGSVIDVVTDGDEWIFEFEENNNDGIEPEKTSKNELENLDSEEISDTVVGIPGGVVTVDAVKRDIKDDEEDDEDDKSSDSESSGEMTDEKRKELWIEASKNEYFQRFVDMFSVADAHEVLAEEDWRSLSQDQKDYLLNGDNIPETGMSIPFVGVADSAMVVLFYYAPSGVTRKKTNLEYDFEAQYFIPDSAESYKTADVDSPEDVLDDSRGSLYSKDYLDNIKEIYSEGFTAWSADDFPAFFSPKGSDKTAIVLAPRIEET